MANVKIQDATKELSQKTAKVLGEATRVRQTAEKTLAELRKIQAAFRQKAEAERAEKLREEQQKAISAQSNAWTMPDDVPVQEAAPAPASAVTAEEQE